MSYAGKLGMSGDVQFDVISPKINKAPLSWKLRNNLTNRFILGWLAVKVLVPLVKKLHLPILVAYGELRIRTHNAKTGEWTDYGVVSRRVITNAGVTFLRDDWNNNAQDFTTFNFHGIGTGTNAENVTDTALQTESTTALNPDSTRATGTRSTPASNQFRSVGTLTCDADIACTEHGLLSQAATGGGTLWDRSVFSVINLIGANPDSIQTTYTGTLTAGG